MPATEAERGTEIERIEAWRVEVLERAGYDHEAAVEIATRLEIDLHRAVELLEQGCPPDIAVRILV